MKLCDLDARFVAATDQGWRDVDTLGEAEGVLFDCPLCGDHKILTWFPNAPATVPGDPSGGKRWTPTGTSLADLSLSPSILLTSELGCGWHGHVRDGETVTC